MTKRSLKRPTPERLRRRALHYLERFAASRAHLRTVLIRRAEREALEHGVEGATLTQQVDRLLDDLERIGLLDDRLYARSKAQSLLERGYGLRRVQAALRQKGIEAGLCSEVVDLIRQEHDDVDMDAADRFAQRRRLGRWRSRPIDDAGRRRELSALARAGFSYEIARRIVDTPVD